MPFIDADLRQYTKNMDAEFGRIGLQLTHEGREFYLLYTLAGLSMPIPKKFTEPVQKVN
jgi:hypothetical protein